MELVPLNPDQHVITFVPKLTAELPFFNLSSYRGRLPSVIKFKGLDEFGHPINWEVYQNTNKEIGSPGADAHRVWYQLVKPAADDCRHPDGTLPEIVPLGRIRECLRKIGWSAGGHQERKLIRALNQIGAAWCVADLWIPTTERDQSGNPKYVQVKGRFSRLSVYAIGERHVTEKELINFTFAFDLEDILYIKLDPLEARMQQGREQRVYENEYWFSVDPAARRWYELMAPKIFGAVKNGVPFCEIRYSWYVYHHHTLKRFYERRRVVEQMNRIVADHLQRRYIKEVEYKAIKEPVQELDYVIRYYPGEGANESIQRIQLHLRDRKTVQRFRTGRIFRPKSERAITSATSTALSATTALHVDLIFRLLTFGVSAAKAYQLATTRMTEVAMQLDVWAFRDVNPRNRAGWIIYAIENNYEPPKSFRQHQQREGERRKREATERAIAACSLCDANGYRRLQRTDNSHGIMRRCTHDATIEARITSDAQNGSHSVPNGLDEENTGT